MKVLVIEDQPAAAVELLGVLKSLGHEAEHARHPAEAWVPLKYGGYRAVVGDWRMPGVSGLDLCRMIRANGGDYIYIILLSATPITRESRAAAFAAGVDDFIAKPIEPEELGVRLHVAERILRLTGHVTQLESFLLVCSYCRKIRDDRDSWLEIDAYLNKRQGTKFTHGICPVCYDREMISQMRELNFEPPPESKAGPPAS